MSLRMIIPALIAFALMSCGVKTDLELPMGAMPQSQVLQNEQKDPSKPPVPLGAPGGTTPPYPTGP